MYSNNCKQLIFCFVGITLLTVVLFGSIPGGRHLQDGILATNDWRERTQKLPAVFSTTSALGKWELDNETIKEVHFSDDPDNPIQEYTVDERENTEGNLLTNREVKRKSINFNDSENDNKDIQNAEDYLDAIHHREKKFGEMQITKKCKEGKVEDKEGNFCFVWYPRQAKNRPEETRYEGVIATQLLINPYTSPPSLFAQLIAQQSLSFFAEAFAMSFRAMAPDLASSHKERKWRAFGYGGDSTQQLKKLFNETNSSDSELLSEYLSSTINQSSTIKLFAQVCRAQERMRKKGNESTTKFYDISNISSNSFVKDYNLSRAEATENVLFDSETVNESENSHINYGISSSVNKLPLHDKLNYDGVLPYMFKSACFWLTEFTFSENNSIVYGRAWSSCGDRLSFTSSLTTYERLLIHVNNASVILTFVLSLPLLYGIYTQINWIRNSRGRTLRVSLAQIYCNLYWVSFTLGLIAMLCIRTPSSGKALELLFSVMAISSSVLVELIMLVSTESARYSGENERAGSTMQVFLLLTVVFFAGMMSISFFQDLITDWRFIIMISVLFWLPQIVHNYKMDSWTGLTTPFIVSNFLLVLTSFIFFSTFALHPWQVKTKTQRVALYGILIVVATTCFLLIFSLTNGRHLLPHWMVPWRHIYATTVEEQRDVLSENVMCPICRASLEEGWDGDSELWQTPCHHLFHKSCLERWMLERMECPLCRTLLPEPESTQLHT